MSSTVRPSIRHASGKLLTQVMNVEPATSATHFAAKLASRARVAHTRGTKRARLRGRDWEARVSANRSPARATARYVVRVTNHAPVDRLDPFAAKARRLLWGELLDEATIGPHDAPPGHTVLALREQGSYRASPSGISGLGRDPRVGVGVTGG